MFLNRRNGVSEPTGWLKNFTGKNLCRSLFLIKIQFWGPASLSKKTPTKVLHCEICKLLEFANFQDNYFVENLWMSASKLYLKRDSNTGVFPWILWNIQEHLFCSGSTNGWFWNISAGSLFDEVASLVKYWVGVQRGHLMGRRCLFSRGWPPF